MLQKTIEIVCDQNGEPVLEFELVQYQGRTQYFVYDVLKSIALDDVIMFCSTNYLEAIYYLNAREIFYFPQLKNCFCYKPC